MHLHKIAICLMLIAVASGYARFTVLALQESALLNAVFIGSTIGLVLCLVRIASRQMEQIGRSVARRGDLREDKTRTHRAQDSAL